MNIPYMDPMGISQPVQVGMGSSVFFVSLLRFCLRIGRFSSVVWCKMARSHVATELNRGPLDLVLPPSRPSTGKVAISPENDSFRKGI